LARTEEKREKETMPTKRNLMVKVIDARPGEVLKLLKNAGIQVVSVVEVYKEDIPEQETAKPADAEKG
jgi:hypothetical protein